MSLQSHLAELERRHRMLEKEIATEQVTPGGSDIRIAELKRKKLHLKDEIERLRVETKSPTVH